MEQHPKIISPGSHAASPATAANVGGPGVQNHQQQKRSMVYYHDPTKIPEALPKITNRSTRQQRYNKENAPQKKRQKVRFTDMEEEAGPLIYNGRDSMYMRLELQREFDFGIPAQEEAHRYARWWAEEMKRGAAEQAALDSEDAASDASSISSGKGYAKADKAVHPNRLSTDLSGLDLDLKNLSDDVSGLDVFSRVEAVLEKQKESRAERKKREKEAKAEAKAQSKHKSSGSISLSSPKRQDSDSSVDKKEDKERKGSRFLRKVISDRIVVRDKDSTKHKEEDDKRSKDIADFFGSLAKQAQVQATPNQAQQRSMSPPRRLSSQNEIPPNAHRSTQPHPNQKDRDPRGQQPPPMITQTQLHLSPELIQKSPRPSSSSSFRGDEIHRRPVPPSQSSNSSVLLVPSQSQGLSSSTSSLASSIDSYGNGNGERRSRSQRSESSPMARTPSPYKQETSEERRPSVPTVPSVGFNNGNIYASQQVARDLAYQKEKERGVSNSSITGHPSHHYSQQFTPSLQQQHSPPPRAPPSSSSHLQPQSSLHPPSQTPTPNSSSNRLPLPNGSTNGHYSSSPTPSHPPSLNGSRQPSPSPTPSLAPKTPPIPHAQQSAEDVFSRIEQEVAEASAVNSTPHEGKGRKLLGKALGHMKDKAKGRK